MTDALTLLRNIGSSHERMAQLADKLDWQGVNAEWANAHPMLLELGKISLEKLPPQERTEAAQLIRKLLALEEQVSARATPWLDQARPLLESFRKYPLNRPEDTV